MFFHSFAPVAPRFRHAVFRLAGLAVLTVGAMLAGAASVAQERAADTPAEQRQATPADRHNQRIETMRHEDAGSRVDELRSGGETRRIAVQPKAAVPAYEVQPAGAHNREAGPGAAGRRVWKIPF